MVQKMYLAIVEEGDRLEPSGFIGPTVRQMQGAPDTSGPKQQKRQASEAEEDELVLTKYTTMARCPEKYALLALQPVTGEAPPLLRCLRLIHAAAVLAFSSYAYRFAMLCNPSGGDHAALPRGW